MAFFDMFRRNAGITLTPVPFRTNLDPSVNINKEASAIASKLPYLLSSEHDRWSFVVQMYERSVSMGGEVKEIIAAEIDIQWVEYGWLYDEGLPGIPNRGIDQMNSEYGRFVRQLGLDVAKRIIATAFVIYFKQNKIDIDRVRLKMATMFCSKSPSNGALWQAVINKLTSSKQGDPPSNQAFVPPSYKSENPDVERAYTDGVTALQQGRYADADVHLRQAAEKGHVSALYNLGILHGGGDANPCDLKFAAECFIKADEGGHPKIKSDIWKLKSAQEGALEIEDLETLIRSSVANGGLSAIAIVVACELFRAMCKKIVVAADVIPYEIGKAVMINDPVINRYLDRSGMDADGFKNGVFEFMMSAGEESRHVVNTMDRILFILKECRVSSETRLWFRYTALGNLIRNSTYGREAEPLLGIKEFHAA